MTLYHRPDHDSVAEERALLWTARDLADTALARFASAPEAMMWLAFTWRRAPDGMERRVRDSAMAFVEEDMTASERAVFARARADGFTHPDEVRSLMDHGAAELLAVVREMAA